MFGKNYYYRIHQFGYESNEKNTHLNLSMNGKYLENGCWGWTTDRKTSTKQGDNEKRFLMWKPINRCIKFKSLYV